MFFKNVVYPVLEYAFTFSVDDSDGKNTLLPTGPDVFGNQVIDFPGFEMMKIKGVCDGDNDGFAVTRIVVVSHDQKYSPRIACF